MKIKTAAKINLALDVTGRLNNGYHLIESVFQTVGIYDEITVELSGEGIQLSCELPEMFARNIAYKAALRFAEETGTAPGCTIHIRKGIPSQAGMGGGSTDAAAVLLCLNELNGKPLNNEKLAALGKKLGADVPFFFTGGTAYVGGIGEEITSLPDFSGRTLLIAKGAEGVSTGEAYARIDALKAPIHPDTDGLVNALRNAPETAHEFFGNLFEQAVSLDEAADIKAAMLASGALNSVMTGSGSAVFGLFGSADEAGKCAGALSQKGYFTQVCETVRDSFTII